MVAARGQQLVGPWDGLTREGPSTRSAIFLFHNRIVVSIHVALSYAFVQCIVYIRVWLVSTVLYALLEGIVAQRMVAMNHPRSIQ